MYPIQLKFVQMSYRKECLEEDTDCIHKPRDMYYHIITKEHHRQAKHVREKNH